MLWRGDFMYIKTVSRETDFCEQSFKELVYSQCTLAYLRKTAFTCADITLKNCCAMMTFSRHHESSL